MIIPNIPHIYITHQSNNAGSEDTIFNAYA